MHEVTTTAYYNTAYVKAIWNSTHWHSEQQQSVTLPGLNKQTSFNKHASLLWTPVITNP